MRSRAADYNKAGPRIHLDHTINARYGRPAAPAPSRLRSVLPFRISEWPTIWVQSTSPGALARRDPAATPGVDPDDVLEDCLVVNSALQASAVNEAFANVGMISPTSNWRLPHLVSKARASSSRDNIARRPSTCTLCPARVV